MPWADGLRPVRYVLCAEHVTAGNTGAIVAVWRRKELMFGVCGPSRPLVNPTTLRTAVRCMWLCPNSGALLVAQKPDAFGNMALLEFLDGFEHHRVVQFV